MTVKREVHQILFLLAVFLMLMAVAGGAVGNSQATSATRNPSDSRTSAPRSSASALIIEPVR